MTPDEMEKVARICSDADGGCPHCVRALFQSLEQSFPDIKPILLKVWADEFGCDYDEEE